MNQISILVKVLIIILILSACKKDEMIENKKPGYFILTELGNIENSSLKSSKLNENEIFDFGDLKASKEYFFLLLNGGDEPIFNISLVMDNSNFSITPSHLNEIGKGVLIDNNNTGIVQILTLGITHGLYLNGSGYADLLPIGINTSFLTITGQTINDDDTIDITSNYDISVTALIMDIELYNNSDKIDLTKPGLGKLSTDIDGMESMRYYYVGKTGIISLKNIGNVSIDLYYGNLENQINILVINPSDSLMLDLPNDINILILDGKGTITDYKRIQRGIDGKGYFGITRV